MSQEPPENAKTGRPKKPDSERRRKVVRTRVTAAEKETIEEKAERANLSVSAYVRRATLGRKIQPRADKKARHELRRIGVNLNQLTRYAHGERRKGDQIDAEALDAAIEELREKIDAL